MKITKAQEKKLMSRLKHITGECECPPGHTTCTYWKYVDGKDRNWQSREILKTIEDVL